MDSWDDDEFEVPDINKVKAPTSWEDEEEEEDEEVVVVEETTAVAKGPLKPKQLKKLKMKEMEEKRKIEQAIAQERAKEMMNESASEKKAREKKQIEDADYENTLDAFGADETSAPVEELEDAIKNMKISSLADHEKFGKLIGSKIENANPKYVLECLKFLIQNSSTNLSPDDMKDINTVVNVIKNEKIQAAKPKGKKKKQSGRQGYAKVERGGGGGGADVDDVYDEYNDFM